MQKELNNMLERFPEHKGKIFELFSSNEDFKSLCEDYWQCKNALYKYRNNVQEDARNENEYAGLSLDLEQEILRFLGITNSIDHK